MGIGLSLLDEFSKYRASGKQHGQTSGHGNCDSDKAGSLANPGGEAGLEVFGSAPLGPQPASHSVAFGGRSPRPPKQQWLLQRGRSTTVGTQSRGVPANSNPFLNCFFPKSLRNGRGFRNLREFHSIREISSGLKE